MKTVYKISAVLFTLALLAGCESIGHITPANDIAEKTTSGEIVAHFTTVSTGSGSIEAIGPGGEVLKGNYGALPADYNFGKVFNAVYGDYSTLPTAADKGTPTVATLTGNMGTTLQCEFYNDDYTNAGFGACRSVTGALYKLQY
jgi:hypothetical protein